MKIKDYTDFSAELNRMNSVVASRLSNALRNVNYTNECLVECWRKATHIACKKYDVASIYDVSHEDAVHEAEWYAYNLVLMCNS